MLTETQRKFREEMEKLNRQKKDKTPYDDYWHRRKGGSDRGKYGIFITIVVMVIISFLAWNVFLKDGKRPKNNNATFRMVIGRSGKW